MAQTTGNVVYVKVGGPSGDDFCFTSIRDQTTQVEDFFILWWTPVQHTIATPNDWVLRSMQVSLLREAVANNVIVTVLYDEGSSFANTVRFGS